MKFVLSFALLTLASAVLANNDKAWGDFKAKHNKRYKSTNDEAKARKNFDVNHKFIEEHNAKYASGQAIFTLGHNPLSDLDIEEYRRTRCTAKTDGIRPLMNLGSQEKVRADFLVGLRQEETVDYSLDSCMTPVKDQGGCGSCYAFSTVAALEFYNCKKTGVKTLFSEQQFSDCTTAYGNNLCEGGFYSNSYDYLLKQGVGIASSASYPYVAKNQTCKYDPSMKAGTVTGYKWSLPQGDENAVMTTFLTAKGPVNVAIDASPSSFMLYKSGIYNEASCSTKVDHAMLLVGYGTLNGVKYWKIKNSHGLTWGTDGYMLLERGTNRCGVAGFVVYPEV